MLVKSIFNLQMEVIISQLLKPLSARWFMDAFSHVQANPDIVKNGFVEAGITEKLKDL